MKDQPEGSFGPWCWILVVASVSVVPAVRAFDDQRRNYCDTVCAFELILPLLVDHEVTHGSGLRD